MSATISRRSFVSSAVAGTAAMTIAKATNVTQSDRLTATVLDEPVDLWDLPTPALVIDADALQYNLAKMADTYKDSGISLRPHAKTHKCPIIAKKQIALGAIGICVAKVSEAQVMLDAGIPNILITSPVVTSNKVSSVISLAKRSPEIMIVVDQVQNVRDLNDAAAAQGVTLQVLIDLNVGTDRTGVAMGRPALELARAIRNGSSLILSGLQAYAGHIQHVNGWQYRRKLSLEIMGRAVEVKRMLEKEGFDLRIFSGGGTGTYNIDSEIAEITDVQVGSYTFMDVNYRNIGGKSSNILDDFRPSLFVLATAISQPAEGLITLDAGYKAFATDQEPPVVAKDESDLLYRWAGDEHGFLVFRQPGRSVRIGERVLLLASHCDPTVNLYDHYYVSRNERVTEIWPVSARGCSQ